MPHPTPYPRCIFCDAKANSREHAIPKWVAKRLGLRGVQLHHRGEVSTIATRRKQPISFASHRERIFCKGCNTHFKHLEDEAIPIVEWMARGRSVVLGKHEQEVLARWGAKTGFALIAAESELRDFVPRAHMSWLREKDEPHPLNWVGYASWNGHVFKSAGDHLLTSPDVEGSYRAYSEVLAFKHLAFKLFGLFEPLPGNRIGLDRPGLKQVWPALDRTISWPLTPAADDSVVETLLSIAPLTSE